MVGTHFQDFLSIGAAIHCTLTLLGSYRQIIYMYMPCTHTCIEYSTHLVIEKIRSLVIEKIKRIYIGTKLTISFHSSCYEH